MSVLAAPERTRTGRPTRAEATELQERLRHAAVEAFLEHGFDGTTMEAIARAAGVTKRTLYVHYRDKRTLFAKVISGAIERHNQEEQPFEAASSDLHEGLTAIGRSALALARDPDVVRLVRMGMTESSRFPELAKSIESLTTSPRIQAVVTLLARHVEAGTVELDDLELAAEQFLAMVTSTASRLAAFGITRPWAVEERNLKHAVNIFLQGVLSH